MLPSTGIKSKTFQTQTASLTISTISGFVHKVSFYLSLLNKLLYRNFEKNITYIKIEKKFINSQVIHS